MRIGNDDLVLSGTSMLTTITSSPVWLGHIAVYSIQLVFTGTPNGTFKLQASNDDGGQNVTSPTITNWTDIGSSSQAISAAGTHMYNVADCGYKWVRLVWSDSSSGNPSTLTVARFNVKGV
jgi:hypothetical protein